MSKNLTSTEIFNKIYKKDSRTLNQLLNTEIIDVTITSPPYFDLKDYGYKKQIGYGQEYSQYLEDLKKVFENVYNCTKNNGTLWVIIDSFRKNNEVTPLPFDFSNKIKEVGWKLQEVIIWAKDRTVPWAHQGQMRNLFEYILLFSKKEKYNFYIDEVRDFESLKKWWIKYPERYNPKGKTPDGLWHFDIPTQGSWGKGYIKHFCPLPEGLIEQILKISTKEGNLVLDPFAGSGAVLAKAKSMNRNYIGFELNKDYIQMFGKYLENTSEQKKLSYENQKQRLLPQNKFNKLIIDLRALKYSRILFSKLPEKFKNDIKKIYVKKKDEKPTKRNAHISIEYIFLIAIESTIQEFELKVEEISSKPPLSKFGLQTSYVFEKNINTFLEHLEGTKKIYSYTQKSTHKFKNCLSPHQLPKFSKTEIILSSIKVDLNEKDYE